jgi:hypothetical protein
VSDEVVMKKYQSIEKLYAALNQAFGEGGQCRHVKRVRPQTDVGLWLRRFARLRPRVVRAPAEMARTASDRRDSGRSWWSTASRRIGCQC